MALESLSMRNGTGIGIHIPNNDVGVLGAGGQLGSIWRELAKPHLITVFVDDLQSIRFSFRLELNYKETRTWMVWEGNDSLEQLWSTRNEVVLATSFEVLWWVQCSACRSSAWFRSALRR